MLAKADIIILGLHQTEERRTVVTRKIRHCTVRDAYVTVNHTYRGSAKHGETNPIAGF